MSLLSMFSERQNLSLCAVKSLVACDQKELGQKPTRRHRLGLVSPKLTGVIKERLSWKSHYFNSCVETCSVICLQDKYAAILNFLNGYL
jgi:hypothetical protein